MGYDNLDEEDHYLLDKDKSVLIQEPIDIVGGWLCGILIARRDFASARLECLQDRGELNHLTPTLTESGRQKYMDW